MLYQRRVVFMLTMALIPSADAQARGPSNSKNKAKGAAKTVQRWILHRMSAKSVKSKDYFVCNEQ